MKHRIQNDSYLGRLLWLTDGNTELALTLDIGPRVIHLSHIGMDNLFYRQPEDLSDGVCTENGWRLIGGHRFWLAPESKRSCWPDRAKVDYSITPTGVIVRQQADAWLEVEKSMNVEFLSNGSISVEHVLTNLAGNALTCSLWGISTLNGGEGMVEFGENGANEYNPIRSISLWQKTSFSDERLSMQEDSISVKHKNLDSDFKIGVFSSTGRVHYTNRNQTFDISIPVVSMQSCADGGCNIEIFTNKFFLELETLGPVVTLQRGARTNHTEIWRVGLI